MAAVRARVRAAAHEAASTQAKGWRLARTVLLQFSAFELVALCGVFAHVVSGNVAMVAAACAVAVLAVGLALVGVVGALQVCGPALVASAAPRSPNAAAPS